MKTEKEESRFLSPVEQKWLDEVCIEIKDEDFFTHRFKGRTKPSDNYRKEYFSYIDTFDHDIIIYKNYITSQALDKLMIDKKLS